MIYYIGFVYCKICYFILFNHSTQDFKVKYYIVLIFRKHDLRVEGESESTGV